MTEEQKEQELLPSEIVEKVEELRKQEKAEGETEVTSLKKEEEKAKVAMKDIKMPSKEEMIQMAMRDYIGGIQMFQAHFGKLSKKGMKRLTIALLQLPQEDEKVHLSSKEEKALFGIGQRLLNARFTLVLNHIDKEIKVNKEKQLSENKENEEDVKRDEQQQD